MKYLALLILPVILLSGCIETPNQYEQLPPGEWRAILKLSDKTTLSSQSEDLEAEGKLMDYFELPFNFKIDFNEEDKMVMHIFNAEESISISDIEYGRDPATAKDTLRIRFNDFDSYIDAFYEENFIEGSWKVPYRGEAYEIPFLAKYGENKRFDIRTDTETYDFSGKWKVEFEFDEETAYPAIAEFRQEGNKLTGTFITETGDYRFLDGIAYGDKMKLSVFDGAHAFLFSGYATGDTIIGEFRSGNHYKCNWIATRDDNFKLTDPYSLTAATASSVNFTFEALNGEEISLSDEKFNDKIKLVNIMGSWCPNCKDEIIFLKEVKKENPDIEIISIAFEKYKDKQKALNVLRQYKRTMNIDWPLLYGGYADKKAISEQLSFIDTFYAYPTLLFINKANEIKHIKTGFYGPATSEYETFSEEIYAKLENMKK